VTANYISGNIRPGPEEMDVCWATKEELMSLDMNSITRGYMLKAFEKVNSISLELDIGDTIS
jgi:hypothetical protein